MQVQVDELRPYLQAFDFQHLLVEGLGWDYYRAEPVSVLVDGHDYTLEPAAEKAGFVVYLCGPGADGSVPPYPVRRKIERQVAKLVFEHLIIFVDAGRALQVWQWVKREAGKPAACREQEYQEGQTGAPILQRLQTIAFALEEEGGLSIFQVASRVGQALDVEKVTKRFYERFRMELAAFQEFIDGITAQGDQEWYASLMLNRMMFVYFVQKQGFLDGDVDYLQSRLRLVQNRRGSGRFQDFYREFLLRLFHEGLGQPESERDPELADLLGRIPFLNGGLFDVHDLERDNPHITIPDEAFERVFRFFDGYRWHLDERPRREDNEINPDVLGYIFEKYVNQKQMGAYYTKEDITGYITRNTVIPFLFDAAKEECPVAFNPSGGVWRLLQDDPDRYIYPAAGHGMAWSYFLEADPVRREEALELPEDIAAGLDDVSQRGGWNRPAPEEYALPTETWREVVARRQHYQKVRDKLTAGDVSEATDLIALNLDAEQFALNAIVQSEGPELLRAFWHALRDVSVLDPTCGSGAFLFAALNILEPLYTACLEGMRGFLDDLNRTQRRHHPQTMSDFRAVLEQADRHPSQRYFILKSIVLHNLYGVDIMEEAVEICKLRLFLKLMAQLESYHQIEPLPDIDFNIRAGNTLVGFTSLDAVRQAMTITPDGQHRTPFAEDLATLKRIEDEAEVASRAFNQFRWQQTLLGGEVTVQNKADLRNRMDNLREQMDRYLAAEYGIASDDSTAYGDWQASHQPFHWFVEFYGIMIRGGFDVVVGNPPWREYSAVKREYQVLAYKTESCGNLYALCAERGVELASKRGWLSFIVQLPFLSSSRMGDFRELLTRHSSQLYYVPFDDRPGKLFDGLQHCRSAIFVAQMRIDQRAGSIYGAKFQRWSSKVRDCLFPGITFTGVPDIAGYRGIFPKLATEFQVSVFRRLRDKALRPIALHIKRSPTSEFVFYQEAMQYWAKATYGLPFYSKNGVEGPPPHGRYLFTEEPSPAQCIGAIINSSLFYVYFVTNGDCFHLSDKMVRDFPVADSIMKDADLARLTRALMKDLHGNAQRKTISTQTGDSIMYEEFSAGGSKLVIDEIDRILSEHYGFTDEELDFIVNYDIKYRMGSDG